MKRFIVATRNEGKLKEIKEILKGFSFEVVSMDDVGVGKDIEETGKTFEENAMLKAREIFEVTKDIVMADDSGLEVDFLNGAPGIYSSRFAGENATDNDKNEKILQLLKDVPFPQRSARFVCVIAVVLSDTDSFTVRGTCEGFICYEPKGDNGFGYDPLFFVPEYNMTTAQMESSKKNEISHRGRALKLMMEELCKRFEIK